uniref:Uncharacterized protein n=1 Tax=Kalanchoe fedtschenkoi TaxID=63787 RepID=A0A7N0T3R7_KALFE
MDLDQILIKLPHLPILRTTALKPLPVTDIVRCIDPLFSSFCIHVHCSDSRYFICLSWRAPLLLFVLVSLSQMFCVAGFYDFVAF